MRFTFLIIGVLLFCSCKKEKSKVNYAEIESAIETDILTFEDETVPDVLINDIRDKRIIIVGESHYIREHNEFVYLMLKKLSTYGFNVFLNEHNHSFSWLAEDFTTNLIDTLPAKMYYFDDYLLQSIKNHNALSDHKITYKFFDINHWSTDFMTSVNEVEKILGYQDIFEYIKNTGYGSESYRNELHNIRNKLTNNTNHYMNDWGEMWYERIFSLVDIELNSLDLDLNSNIDDINKREEIMISIIEKELENPSNKIVINCGASHAQKTAYINSSMDRLGVYLASNYKDEVYSLRIYGLSGQFKSNYYKAPIEFNLCSDSSTDNFTGIICRHSDNRYTLLKLNNPAFDNENIKITFPPGNDYLLSPYRHFDAYITIPDVSIIESFDLYELE